MLESWVIDPASGGKAVIADYAHPHLFLKERIWSSMTSPEIDALVVEIRELHGPIELLIGGFARCSCS